MGLSMYKLDFDPASPSEADRVGSFIIGADGTNVLEIYVEDAASAGGEKGLVMLGVRQDAAGSPVSADGDFHPFLFNNDGELKVAADLTSSVADDDVNSGNPVLIGSVAYAATLSALSATGDRGNLASDVYRRIHVNDSANIAASSTATSIADTATLVATALAGRKKMTIQNLSSSDIYLGGSGVTTSNGLLLKKGDSYTEAIGAGCALYGIVASGTANVRVLQLA